MIACPRCGVDSEGVDDPCASCGGAWIVSGVALAEQECTSPWSHVYLARPSPEGARIVEVVLPSVSEDEEFRRTFDSECELLTSLGDHADVPMQRVLAAGVEPGSSVCFVVREQVPAETLESRLRRGAAPPPRQLIAAGLRLIEALSALHARGLVHGDVGAASVLFPRRQRSEAGVLLAGMLPGRRAVPPDLAAGAQAGSLDYQCPERVSRGELDAASDQYSLAIVLYRALTGHFPGEAQHARGRSPALLRDHLLMREDERAAAVLDLPAPLRPAFQRAMAREPQDRHGSVGAFARALRLAAEELPLGHGPGTPAEGKARRHDPTTARPGGAMRARVGSPSREATSARMDSSRSAGSHAAGARPSRGGGWWLAVGALALVTGVVWLARPEPDRGQPPRELVAAMLPVTKKLDAVGELLQQVSGARSELGGAASVERDGSLGDWIHERGQRLASARAALGRERSAEAVARMLADADREATAVQHMLDLLRALGRALSAQRGADRMEARVTEHLAAEAPNEDELLNIGGGGQDLVLDELARTRERLQQIAALDLGDLVQVSPEELHVLAGRVEELVETLSSVAVRMDKACELYALAVAEGEPLVEAFAQDCVRVFDESELAVPPAEFAAVEEWLVTESESFDAAVAAMREAASSRAVRVAVDSLQDIAGRMKARADRLQEERMTRQRQELVDAVEVRLPVVDGLLAEAGIGGTRAGLDESCAAAVADLEAQVAAYRAAQSLVDRAAVADSILRTGDRGQRCLASLFTELARRRRAELEAVVAGTDDGSERFQRIRATYERAVAGSDVSMDPLATLATYNDLEFSVYKHVRTVSETLQVDLQEVAEGAGEEPSLEAPAAVLAEDLAALVERLGSPAPDLVAITQAMVDFRRRLDALEIQIESAVHRMDAVDLRAEAVAMELRLKELYIGRAMRVTDEDLYQTGVRVLGEGRVKFESGDYSGAKASFEFCLDSFSRIRR